MNKLEEARLIIDEVDSEIVKLFEKRMKAAEMVFDYKKEHGLSIDNFAREAEIINKNTDKVSSDEIKPYYISLQKSLIEISKRYQRKLQNGIRVAYSGIEGAFAHIAVKKIFPDAAAISYSDFYSAYKSVEEGETDMVVLPVENSTAGEVGTVLDIILDGRLYINEIYNLSVNQNLVGKKGTNLKDIKTVISHPQALEQANDFIKEHHLNIIESTNTAVAAKTVADGNDESVAAIASDETAKIYGLEVLEKNINRLEQNTTKFAVLTPILNENKKDNTIIFFTVQNESGSLAKVINVIAKYNFNMTCLRSRPLKDKPWEYYFYVEIDKNVNSEIGKIMINELKSYCNLFKIAGTFTNNNII